MNNQESGGMFPTRSYAPDFRSLFIAIDAVTGGGNPTVVGPVASRPTPAWVVCLAEKYAGRILRPLIEAKPGKTLDWWKNGFSVGVGERSLDFWDHDAVTAFENLSPAGREAYSQLFDCSDAREEFRRLLGLPVDSDVKVDEMAASLWEGQQSRLETLFTGAEKAAKSAGPAAFESFSKGKAAGYSAVIDTDGQFTHQTQRRFIYEILLGHWVEIDEGCHSGRFKTRPDLYEFIKSAAVGDILHGEEWFGEICKEIGLSVGKRMHPPQSE